MPDALEEYLVEQILKVENDAFVYNDQTLPLLSHSLFSTVGLAGNQLRSKLYKGFMSFILDKAKVVCSNYPGIKDFVGTLPSVLRFF